MPALVILATSDAALAEAWEKQLPSGRIVMRFDGDDLSSTVATGSSAVVVLDCAVDQILPQGLAQLTTIVVGEPKSLTFEQSRLSRRGRVFLGYQESVTRLREVFPLVEEIAEKDAMVRMLTEKLRRGDTVRTIYRGSNGESAELWDFLEGAIENLDARDRLIAEFRRASRHLLRASHVVFFLKETDGFRADRGTSFFPVGDPLVGFFENHPAVIDDASWDGPSDPVAELAVRNRLALWGARLLVPVHDNGRLLGLIALGVRNDGQPYDDSDRNRAVFFARLLRNFLIKATQFGRLSHVASQVVLGARYLPGTIVLGPDENAPRHVPLVVRDLVGQARRTREVCRAAPCLGQPFRASAGVIAETGGIWACWEEASGEVHDTLARERVERREVLREIALTLSHELGNALVSLATFRQTAKERPMPSSLMETIKRDVSQLEALNGNLGIMQNLHEASPVELDIRDLAQRVGVDLGIRVDVGPEPIVISGCQRLLEFSISSILRTIGENRKEMGLSDIALKVRSTGSGGDLTALLAIRGKDMELEGILPEPVGDGVPNQGRMGVFLAKEVLRLHNGEIHSGPGIDGIEILISIRRV
jgi:hypothetical protein